MKVSELQELKRLATDAGRCEWVSEPWAFEHFGSEMEAKFVAAASPRTVLRLIAEIERLERIREAAENLVKVKGRHHSQIAYERLVSALSAPE